MFRIFFTGAFRKRGEFQTGSSAARLVMIGLLEGFAGYSLPDDLLSGVGVRIVRGDHRVGAGRRNLPHV